jgi:hypothetical protein
LISGATASILAASIQTEGAEAMNDRGLAKTVEQLQEAVAALERRHDDLALKTQMMSSRLLGSWGWDRFLSTPEFWENVMDVGLSECSKGCIKTLQDRRAEIANLPCEERAAAYAQASADAQECHRRCADRFPITPF